MDDGQSDNGAGWLDVSLLGIQAIPVRRLSGFRKQFHRVPTEATMTSDNYVQGLAQQEVDTCLDEAHESLRKLMRYRRNELDCQADRLSTPDFTYFVSVNVDPNDTDYAQIRRELYSFKSPDILTRPQFTEAFAREIDHIEVRHGSKIDIEELIDQAEDLGLSVNYPRDLSFAEILLVEQSAMFTVRDRVVTMTSIGPCPLDELTHRFMDSTLFLAERKLKILPDR